MADPDDAGLSLRRKTPWGGNRLRELYGKATKKEYTGESLEVSTLPGLESRDDMGRTLPELVKEFGERMVGSYAKQPFPLLLKLIDARDKLSVQVHPGDNYAAARENEDSGKSEAWLILDTPKEGGELIYGVRPGTTLQALREACETGKGIDKVLNRVKAYPGDVIFIPAGCIHAVGEGIVLYEIQQPSDLTYRFYDWNRTDAQGNRRELHLDKALDVVDLKCSAVPVRVEKAYGMKRVLSEDCFTLDVIRTDTMVTLPEIPDFGILTVTEGELNVRFAGASMKLKAGQTCILPKNAAQLAVEGIGAAALAMPG